MNLIQIIPEDLRFQLGWTLIHSVWQGAIIFIAVAITLRLVPSRNASLRYIVGCTALSVQLLMLVITFSILQQNQAVGHVAQNYWTQFRQLEVSGFNQTATASEALAIDTVTSFINLHMSWLVAGWCLGVAIFSMRLLGGLVYIQLLKRRIIPVSRQWEELMVKIAEGIKVSVSVKLGESRLIRRPLVIGIVKPAILFPIGLMANLSIEQVEAILIHELTHVKRYDYLINLIQSCVEIILFFNPFVWLLSSTIRRERENRCDDLVIKSGLNRVDYVKALARVEEFSLYPLPALAMGFSKNRFQVFNRIKRIMENSVHNKSNKVRPIGLLALLAIGLACASWLAPEKSDTEKPNAADESVVILPVAADTTHREKKAAKANAKEKDKTEKKGSYSRSVITTFDEDGNPHEEITESFEGDEELRAMFSDPGSFSFTIPPIPDIPMIAGIHPIPDVPANSFNGFYYSLDGDSIPGFGHFSDKDRERWEEFGREMRERFERMGEENSEFGARMQEWAERFNRDFSVNFDGVDGQLQQSLERLQESLENLQESEQFQRGLEQGLRTMEESLRRMESDLKNHEGTFRKFEERMKQYEGELHDQLVEDGYLKKGEKIESMSWSDDELSINGIKIKEKDLPKYEQLNKKYLINKRGFYFSN